MGLRGQEVPASERVLTADFGRLLAAHFLQSLGWTSMVLLPLYLEHLSASRAEIGAIIAAARVGGLLSRPAVGVALDAAGRRPTLLLGTALLVLGMLLIAFVDALGPLLYASRLIFGVGLSATFAGYFTFAADLIPPSRRTEGLAIFGVSGLLPMALAPLVERAGVEPSALRWYLPAVGLLVAASAWPLMRVTDRFVRPTERWSVRAAMAASLDARMWPLWIATLIFSGMVALFLAFASVTAAARGMAHPSSLWLSYALGAVGARVLGARLPDRVGPANMIAPTLAIYVLACVLIAGADDATSFLLVGLLAGVAHGYCFPVLSSLVMTRMPAALRGTAMAAFTFLWDLSALVLSPLLGLVADAEGDAVMYALTALVATLALIPWVVLERLAARAQ